MVTKQKILIVDDDNNRNMWNPSGWENLVREMPE